MKKTMLKNQKGMATVEALPLLVIFLIFIGYGMGLFGVIHTGILHSIAARTYTFETLRNRTNVTYFRENMTGISSPIHFKNFGMRFHIIQNEKITDTDGDIVATSRPISMGQPAPRLTASTTDHNVKIYEIAGRNKAVAVSPAWIMVGYGICLNVGCGDVRTNRN